MDLRTLWDRHRAADWPKFSSPNEGELMTLDTVISGCATYYFEEQNLDAPRRAMLGDGAQLDHPQRGQTVQVEGRLT